MKQKQNIWKLRAASFALAIIIFLLVGELVTRGYLFFKKDLSPYSTVVSDTDLGWKPKPNFSSIKQLKDGAGVSYSANIEQDQNGFRTYQLTQADTADFRVFILGDSFTHAIEVSNEKTYPNLLAKSLPIELSSFGGIGYGSLQELLVLEQYYNEIKPDLLLLQFCSNVFLNNHFELEKNAFFNNNKMRRPYMNVSGEIFYKTPLRFGFNALKDYSKFAHLVLNKLEQFALLQKKKKGSNSEQIILENPDWEIMQESVQITEKILGKMVAKMGDPKKVKVFHVHDYQPYLGFLRIICRNLGVDLIEGVPYLLQTEMEAGRQVYGKDGAHWNDYGHKEVARLLDNALRPFIN